MTFAAGALAGLEASAVEAIDHLGYRSIFTEVRSIDRCTGLVHCAEVSLVAKGNFLTQVAQK